jgi:hypothetical protein
MATVKASRGQQIRYEKPVSWEQQLPPSHQSVQPQQTEAERSLHDRYQEGRRPLSFLPISASPPEEMSDFQGYKLYVNQQGP